MTTVSIVGAAMIPMGRHRTSSYSGLGVPPLLAVLRDAGIAPSDVDAMFCGHTFGGMLTGQRVAKAVGIGGVPVINVDNACSGGATAVHQAVRSIRSGEHELVLVLGIDKLTQFGGGTLPLVEEDWEVQQGMVMPALYAMRARRFLADRGATLEDLAAVSVKARDHGSRNPYAQYREPVTVEQVLASRPIAGPLTLLQCCPTGDGAAALLLASPERARALARPTVHIRASVLHSGSPVEGFRDMLRPEITYHSAADAYEEAGISSSDLDVVELHDAFTIAELIYYEALGLCGEGDALPFSRRGAATYGGDVVVNPSGGLLAKGHPVGASGAAQMVELYWQLTGVAGARQVDGARWGLAHVTGGGVAQLDHGACAVHILERASTGA